MACDITRYEDSKTIQMPDPIPLYGSLVVSSSPTNARISIDGKYVGETPKYISQEIVGEHSIAIELEGYVPQMKSVNIKEGIESSVSFNLARANKSNSSDSTIEYGPNDIVTSTGARIIRSDMEHRIFATARTGEKLVFDLPDGPVNKWEIANDLHKYVVSISNGILITRKEGGITLIGYVNNKPHFIRLQISNKNTEYQNKKTYRIVNTKSFSMHVGERVKVVLNEGAITKWDLLEYESEYISVNKDIIRAKKAGKIVLQGHRGSEYHKEQIIITILPNEAK